LAATIAAGLHGIEHQLDPGAAFRGNAYEAEDVPRVPWALVDAIGEFERSEIAVKALGEDVHFHLLNTARQEWATFNRVVTDWERRRNFEQT
jgi:glutamine synthetase